MLLGVVGLLEIGLISMSLVVGWLVMLCCWFHLLVIGWGMWGGDRGIELELA